MKTILGVLTLSIFFVLTLSIFSIAEAGVAGYENTTYTGVFSGVKCGDGVRCSKSGQNLLVDSVGVRSVATFTSGDATPSVAGGVYFKTFLNNTTTITDFDDGYQGKTISVLSQGPVTLDVTSTNLKCGTTDIVTASGDMTRFVKVDTEWRCISRTKASGNMN